MRPSLLPLSSRSPDLHDHLTAGRACSAVARRSAMAARARRSAAGSSAPVGAAGATAVPVHAGAGTRGGGQARAGTVTEAVAEGTPRRAPKVTVIAAVAVPVPVVAVAAIAAIAAMPIVTPGVVGTRNRGSRLPVANGRRVERVEHALRRLLRHLHERERIVKVDVADGVA